MVCIYVNAAIRATRFGSFQTAGYGMSRDATGRLAGRPIGLAGEFRELDDEDKAEILRTARRMREFKILKAKQKENEQA